MFKNALLSGALALALGAGTLHAQAGPIFLAAHGRTLYRTTLGGPVETFTLADEVIGLAQRADGSIIATSPTPVEGGSTLELYTLDGVDSESPMLTSLATSLDATYSAVEFIGDTLFAFKSNTDELYTIDLTDFSEHLVGSTRLGTLHPGGAAYNPIADTLYLGENSTDSLYSVDYNPGGDGADPLATLVGEFGVDSRLLGFDFFDGVLYGALEEMETRTFSIGSIDMQSGLFQPLLTLDQSAPGGSVALAVVPSPGSLALLAAAGLIPLSRRRR